MIHSKLKEPTFTKKNILNYPNLQLLDFFSKELKDEFETVVVNEPSVFEPLKFYCLSLAYCTV